MKRAIRRPIKTNQPAPVNSKKQSSATRVPSTPAHQSATGTDRWKACRLVDERTGNTFIGIDFPNNLGDYSFEIIESDLVASPARVRDRLKSRGATLGGTKNDQITFISRILKNMEPTPLFLAMKPGFRGNGFILGEHMFGTAKGRYRSRRGYDPQGPGKLVTSQERARPGTGMSGWSPRTPPI